MPTARSRSFPNPGFRSGSRPTGSVLVVVGGGGTPDWVVRWCRQFGLELRRQRVPPSVPGDLPAAAEKVDAIADIAEAAARTGGTVLALSEPEPPRPGRPRVVVAVKNLHDDAAALADAAAAAAQLGGHLVVAHGVPASFAERSIGLHAALHHARSLLDAAVQQASAVPGLSVEPWLARVHPHELVGESLDADLLVLGGPRGDLSGRLGLVARSALHHAPCAVLLAPRPARSGSGL